MAVNFEHPVYAWSDVYCDKCHAEAGAPCLTTTSHRPHPPHIARIRRAEDRSFDGKWGPLHRPYRPHPYMTLPEFLQVILSKVARYEGDLSAFNDKWPAFMVEPSGIFEQIRRICIDELQRDQT